jgi:hypothetical protein
MMPKRLVMVNTVLGLIAAGLFTYIVWEMTRPLNGSARPRPRPASAVSPSALPAPAGRDGGGPAAWANVASRNLFSPARSDAGGASAGIAAAPLGPKPNLYGVVLREGSPIAYLEDPVTRRVSAYRVGDNVGGGVVKSITADGVMLARPDGQMDVRLHDPSKPRPAIPVGPQAGAPGGAPGQPPAENQPATPPPVGQVNPLPSGAVRRPLPPNILRRLPQGSPAESPGQSDAPNQ